MHREGRDKAVGAIIMERSVHMLQGGTFPDTNQSNQFRSFQKKDLGHDSENTGGLMKPGGTLKALSSKTEKKKKSQ